MYAAGLRTFTPDPSGNLNVLGQDGYSLSVDGADKCVLKKSHYISLCSLLESKQRIRVEPAADEGKTCQPMHSRYIVLEP